MVAWAEQVLTAAVQELHESYYKSWHTLRTNPDLVRAKAGVLEELQQRILAKIHAQRLDL